MDLSGHWWCEFFDRELAELILGELRPGELDFLTEHLKLGSNSKVFDQCCGWGRVAGPLSDNVDKVLGVDASASMIESGQRCWSQVEFVLGDAANYVPKPCFDAAMNLYSSFGYTESDAYNYRLLGRLVASVKTGGRVVLDTINPHRVFDDFRPELVTTTRSGKVITRRCELKRREALLYQDWTFETVDGALCERRGLTKLYDSSTLERWLKRAGCKSAQALGSLAGNSYTKCSERLILVGQA